LGEVGLDHFAHQLGEGRAKAPAEPGAGLRGVALQQIDLGRPQVALVDRTRSAPERASMPTSSTPAPRHTIRRSMQAKASSMNSRTLCASPVART
jgi:hypothetical protein